MPKRGSSHYLGKCDFYGAMDNHYPSDRNEAYKNLKDCIDELVQFYQNGVHPDVPRMLAALHDLQTNLDKVIPIAEEVHGFAHTYDFDEETKGNGYRSYLDVLAACVDFSTRLCRNLNRKKHSLYYKKEYYIARIESWSQVMSTLATVLTILTQTHACSNDGCLFPSDTASLFKLMKESGKIDHYAFYGRVSGFQYAKSVRMSLVALGIAMAAYSEIYYGKGSLLKKTAISLTNSSKYVLHPELRAKRVVNVSMLGSVNFIKSYLMLADNYIMSHLPRLFSPNFAVNKVIALPPVTMDVPGVDGSIVKITPPDSHIGPRPISCRLLSSKFRRGMIGENGRGSVEEPSQGFVFNCHGGGFVASSSRTQEVYLRDWCRKLNAPIFSVDYVLAPEARFPRQLEECFYAYCWAVANAPLLGSTAERICLAGDSAGGNLALGVVLKCIEHGVRPPSGLYLAYTPVHLEMVPCPARLLCLMDPLIPFGFLVKCYEAYIGEICDENSFPAIVTKMIELDTSMDSENEYEDPKPQKSELEVSPRATFVVGEDRSEDGYDKEYVGEFLNKYVKDEENAAKWEELSEHEELNVGMDVMPSKVGQIFSSISVQVNNSLSYLGLKKNEKRPEAAASTPSSANSSPRRKEANPAPGTSTPQRSQQKESRKMSVLKMLDGEQSVEQFHSCDHMDDPYVSPYHMRKEVLRQLPQSYLITTDLDPCLDDSIEFAKKLRSLNVPVELQILKGLPHAFLMFTMTSKEAMRGSDISVRMMRDVLYKPLIDRHAKETNCNKEENQDEHGQQSTQAEI